MAPGGVEVGGGVCVGAGTLDKVTSVGMYWPWGQRDVHVHVVTLGTR